MPPGGTAHILSVAILGSMDDWLQIAYCLKGEWKGILRREKKKKKKDDDISPAAHIKIVAAIKLFALNKQLSGNKCLLMQSA